jgi:3,4-dihydroxy 2-butanone 4-phosphate synthase / GTP cyclohydrolase II
MDGLPGACVAAQIPPDGKASVEAALDALRRGEMVIVVDDEQRENEGDLIMAAECATPAALAFMIRYTSGIICVGMPDRRADELGLVAMVPNANDPRGTAFTISVDLRNGTSTGVSASDRAATIRALADPGAEPNDLTRPGHVFPLRSRPGGVLERPGHTESAVDLCVLAGLQPIGVLAEVTNDDGTMARRPDLVEFAARHNIVILTVDDIVRHRQAGTTLLRQASSRVPTRHGEFTAVAFQSTDGGIEHLALVRGDIDQRNAKPGNAAARPPLVRLHSECLTGDVFGSRRCDCGEQLDDAMAKIAEAARGVIVYLRGHEGRGIGLTHKLRAYALQDSGLDTVEANFAQGLPVDSRDYGAGAQILHHLGIQSVRLLTNNPAKCEALTIAGIKIVARHPIAVPPNPDNLHYLRTKRLRMNHLLPEEEIS